MRDTDDDERGAVPMLLWLLHRSTGPGECVPDPTVGFVDQVRRRDIVDGGGFERVDGETLRRQRTLADTVGPGLRMLMVGLNPSLYAADAGVGFARPGNRFWPAALAAGIVSVDRDPLDAFERHGIGMTDLVKRATVAADELSSTEYVEGVARLERLCGWLRPAVVCVAGLTGWRAAVDRRAGRGWQPAGLAGVPVYVMPNPSGLNARVPVAELATDLATACAGR